MADHLLLRTGDDLLLRQGGFLLLRGAVILPGTPHDPLIHIHRNPGEPCVACGDADTEITDFVLDPGYWNTINRRCEPTVIISPDFVITGRRDIRTSALLGERLPFPPAIRRNYDVR